MYDMYIAYVEVVVLLNSLTAWNRHLPKNAHSRSAVQFAQVYLYILHRFRRWHRKNRERVPKVGTFLLTDIAYPP